MKEFVVFLGCGIVVLLNFIIMPVVVMIVWHIFRPEQALDYLPALALWILIGMSIGWSRRV